MRSMNATNFAQMYSGITRNEADRAEWLKLYNVSSSAARLPANGAPALYCAIEGLDPESYGNCFCSAVISSH